MNIQELQALVTTDLLNSMLAESSSHSVQVDLLQSRRAQFPYLDNGASNNALFLELSITVMPAGALPAQLVLKAGTNTGGSAAREVAFFKMAAAKGGIPGVVGCYAQKMLAEHDLGLMLLEQVPAKAITYAGPRAAHLQHYCEAARILAALHVTWWEDPAIGVGELTPQWTSELLGSAISLANAGFQQLLEDNDGVINADQQARVRAVLAMAGPLMTARTTTGPLCVTHGDAALWNFVMDRETPALTTLVDFQMWNVNPPAWDLAYMTHLLWPAEFRRQHGDGLVKAYLAALEARGVTYTMADFDRDLGLSVIGLFVLVLAYYRLGIWNDFEACERISRLLLSFEALGGDALLLLPC